VVQSSFPTSSDSEAALTGKNEWTAYQASVACRRNAETLVDDAEALFEHGSYGRAISLLVLSEEELGKSFLWALAAMGIPVPRRVLRNHMNKQLVAVSTMLSQELFLEGFAELVDGSAEGKDLTHVVAYLEAVKAKIRVAASTSAAPRIAAEARRVAELSQKKEMGFYVDVRPEGKLLVPQHTSKDEAQQYLRLMRQRLGESGRLPNVTSEQLEPIVQLMAPILAVFKDDIVKRLSAMDDSH
jgi:AbiV family abortive infection protein